MKGYMNNGDLVTCPECGNTAPIWNLRNMIHRFGCTRHISPKRRSYPDPDDGPRSSTSDDSLLTASLLTLDTAQADSSPADVSSSFDSGSSSDSTFGGFDGGSSGGGGASGDW